MLGIPAKIQLDVTYSTMQPREVIHCLQRQGSPAATSKSCKLKPRRHFEPGGAAKRRPLFLCPPLRTRLDL
jgi:hypothetical protein